MSSLPLENGDTWTHHLLMDNEGIQSKGDFIYTMGAWHYPISKSIRQTNGIAISGRLLSLVDDGLEAHAQARAAKMNNACFHGIAYATVEEIQLGLAGDYEVEPDALKEDPAHSNLRYIRERTTWDTKTLCDEILRLFEFFKFAEPESKALSELEAQAGS